jgi:hypothetical protein
MVEQCRFQGDKSLGVKRHGHGIKLSIADDVRGLIGSVFLAQEQVEAVHEFLVLEGVLPRSEEPAAQDGATCSFGRADRGDGHRPAGRVGVALAPQDAPVVCAAPGCRHGKSKLSGTVHLLSSLSAGALR